MSTMDYRHRSFYATLLTAMGWCALCATPAFAQGEVSAESEATTPVDATRARTLRRAEELFRQGSLAYTEGRYEAAMTLLEESYRLSQRPALLFNMANTLERLGRTRDAVNYLKRYLPHARPDRRRSIRTRIKSLEARIQAEQEAEARAQEAARLELEALRRSAAQAELAAEPSTDETPIAPIALFTASGLALGSGVAFAVLSRNANSSGVDQCLDTGGGNLLCQAGADSDLDSAKTLGVVADISFGVSLAAAVTGVVLLIVGSGDEPASERTGSSLSVGGALGPSGGLVQVGFQL